MIVYVESQDMIIPALEITYNSVSKYKRDSLSSDVKRIFSKAESTDGLFRAPDSVVVNWQELPETIGISRKNVFWVAADLEASNSSRTVHYIYRGIPIQELNEVLLTAEYSLYSPYQHAGSVLTHYIYAISNRGESGLTPSIIEAINGTLRYWTSDNGWTEVNVGNSGIEIPDENGEAFNKFLEFLDVSIPGMVEYMGGGRFLVTTKPRGSLVVENGTRDSPPVGLTVTAGGVTTALGGPGTVVASGVTISHLVDNYGDSKRNEYRESTENKEKIRTLNQAGSLCGVQTHPGDTSDPLSDQRVSDCRKCVTDSEAYDNFADSARDGFVSGELTEAVVAMGAACVVGAIIAGVASWWCGGCLGIGVVAACAVAAATTAATSVASSYNDYSENEAYIDSVAEGAVGGCSNLY